MRFILGSTDTENPPPDDKWILYTTTGTFDIASFLSQGFDSVDAYLVGAGGGGGGGNKAFTSATRTQVHGGGGGGAGGAGAYRSIFGIDLSTLLGSNPVTVGAGRSRPTSGRWWFRR
jgi:hypothetical protein